MRGLLTLAGLLVALATVGLLVRKQMAVQPVVPLTQDVSIDAKKPQTGDPTQRSQQMQQQVKQALDAAMQARPQLDDH